MIPEPGDVLRVGGEASVQFAGNRAFPFRVTVVSKQPTYDGWIWLTGYVLNRKGEAVEKREIFVQTDGLRLLHRPTKDPAAIRPANTAARAARPVVRRTANPPTGRR